MKLAVPRELREDERRVALVPESVKKLVKAGMSEKRTYRIQTGIYCRSVMHYCPNKKAKAIIDQIKDGR
jgi:NAD/NADP transhydrogenase alpha subunit